MMKLGLSMLFLLRRPFKDLLKQLEKVEVKNIELVDDGLHALNGRRVRAIGEIMQDRGFQVTVHAPFSDINISSFEVALRRAMLNRLKRSILLSSQLNSALWIFHPGLQTGLSHFYPGSDWEQNLKSVRELKRTGEQCGVPITIENTPDPFPFLLKTTEDFVRFYESLDDVDVGLTLDVGHANINGQINGFIAKFHERIVHMHLHDNHGDFDSHLGIGQGDIDWTKVIEMLKNVGYKGTLVVESEKNVEESLQKLRTLLRSIQP